MPPPIKPAAPRPSVPPKTSASAKSATPPTKQAASKPKTSAPRAKFGRDEMSNGRLSAAKSFTARSMSPGASQAAAMAQKASPLPAVSPAVKTSVEAVNSKAKETKYDARATAKEVKKQAETLKKNGATQADIDAFLKLSAPTVETAVTAANKRKNPEELKEVYTTLAGAAKDASPAGAQALAKAVLKDIPADGKSNVDQAFKAAAKEGTGINFATALIGELNSTGHTEAANRIAKFTAEGVADVRGDFEDAAAKVATLNQELEYLTATNQGLLSPEQLNKATEDFKARHADDYARFESTGEKVAALLPGMEQLVAPNSPFANSNSEDMARLRGEAVKVFAQSPEIQDTQAGQKATEEALLARGANQPSWLDGADTVVQAQLDHSEGKSTSLDSIGGVSDTLKKYAKLPEKWANKILKIGAQAAAKVPGLSATYLDALAKSERAFTRLGISSTDFKGIVSDMHALRTAQGAEAIETINKRIEEQLKGAKGNIKASSIAETLRGAAVIFGAIGTVTDVAQWGSKSNTERAQIIANGLAVTGDGINLILGVIGKTHLANGGGAILGAATGLFTATLNGIDAFKAFKHGNNVDGAYFTVQALSNIALAASAAGPLLVSSGLISASGALATALPGIGAAAAAVLIVSGLAYGQYKKVEASNKYEGPTEDFLAGAGIDRRLAKALSNHDGSGHPPGPVIEELAKYLGVKGPELLTKLDEIMKERGYDAVQTLLEHAVHKVDPNSEGQYPVEASDEERARLEAGHRGHGNGESGNRVYSPRQPTGHGATYSSELEPQSVEGLAIWMQQLGLLPDGARLP